MRDRTAKDEPARLHAGDLVDLGAGPRMDQFVHRAAECTGISEQRGDVAKQNARLGIVGNRADRDAQRIFERRHHWREP